MSSKNSGEGGKAPPITRYVEIDGKQIEYRTLALDDAYVELEDPEYLATLIKMRSNISQYKVSIPKWKTKLGRRLAELQYQVQGIPEEKEKLAVFRAKHKHQCFITRLHETERKIKIADQEGAAKRKTNIRQHLRNQLLRPVQAEIEKLRAIHEGMKTDSEKEELGKILKQLEIIRKETNKIINPNTPDEPDRSEPEASSTSAAKIPKEYSKAKSPRHSKPRRGAVAKTSGDSQVPKPTKESKGKGKKRDRDDSSSPVAAPGSTHSQSEEEGEEGNTDQWSGSYLGVNPFNSAYEALNANKPFKR